VCRAIREFYRGPILMMTARDQETDEVLGLELGADDYLTKPVKPRVLLSRIKALFRRINVVTDENHTDDHLLKFGQLHIDSSTRTTLLAGNTISISSNEFDVLWLLAESAGEVVTRNELVTKLRGVEYDGFDRSVDIMVSRLRKKLADNANNPFRIKTVWGRGYLFVADAWQ
jgi:DNA-binding response OmpR family regulator